MSADIPSFQLELPKLSAFKDMNYANLFNICPDVKLTRLGPYKTNEWVRITKRSHLGMFSHFKEGINEDNYQKLLWWSYMVLSEPGQNEPAIRYSKDLLELVDERIKIPFLMSFPKRAYLKPLTIVAIQDLSNLIWLRKMVSNIHVEREFYKGERKPIIRERLYEGQELVSMDMFYFDKNGRLILRHDDTEHYGYEQLDDSIYMVGSKASDDLFELNRINKPLGHYLHRECGRAFLNLYTEEIHTPKNLFTLTHY